MGFFNLTFLTFMNKFIAIAVLAFLGVSSFAQENNYPNYIVIKNDTVFGKLKRKNIRGLGQIQITNIVGKTYFKRKEVDQIFFEGKTFTARKKPRNRRTIDSVNTGKFNAALILDGEIQVYDNLKVYRYFKNKLLFNARFLKYMADDFSESRSFFEQRNWQKDTVLAFVETYNAYKKTGVNDSCFATKHFHYHPSITPKLALNFVGLFPLYHYAGLEFGLSKSLTLTTKLSLLFYEEENRLEPAYFLENTISVFPFMNYYIKKEKSTYKYSGFNLSATYMKAVQDYITDAFRFEIGFKTVSFNNLFLDTNLGIIQTTFNGEVSFWGTTGIGYAF